MNEAHTDAFDMLVEIVGIDSEDRLMLALVDTMMNGWTPPDLGFGRQRARPILMTSCSQSEKDSKIREDGMFKMGPVFTWSISRSQVVN